MNFLFKIYFILINIQSKYGFCSYLNLIIICYSFIIQVSTSLAPSASFSNFHDDNVVTSASISLHHGETSQCMITLKNVGLIPVEMLEVEVNSILDPILQNQIFTWDNEEIKRLLPIQPNESASFTITLYAAANFLAPNVAISPTIPADTSSGLFSSMSASLPG